jgi:tryptophan synthase alpha chain
VVEKNMARLSTRLNEIGDDGGKALVAYIVAGDPQPQTTVPLMHELVAAGVDVIELGIPFSDPEAEGPVIQLAHERALRHKVSLSQCLDMVSAFREQNERTPVVLMGYLNPIESMGYENFAKRAAEAGVNGTIIVNLPPEEAGGLSVQLKSNGVESVYLLAPTTTDQRAAMICEASSGFVYYVSLKGTTGASSLDASDVREKVGQFRKFCKLPILVGFGVKDAETASAVAEVADGAVVGSAIVKIMAECESDDAELFARVGSFVRELRAAL